MRGKGERGPSWTAMGMGREGPGVNKNGDLKPECERDHYTAASGNLFHQLAGDGCLCLRP